MPQLFEAPWLGASVELTDERAGHIRVAHVDGERVLERLAATIVEPDLVMRSRESGEMLVAKRHTFAGRTRYAVAIVVEGRLTIDLRRESENPESVRYWIVTAYSARRISREGERWRRR